MGTELGLGEPALAHLQKGLERRVERPLGEFIASSTARSRTAPALVLHDAGDKMVPFSEGRKLAKNLKNSNFMQTEGLGHNRILRDDGVCKAIVDFVSATEDTCIAQEFCA